MNNNTDKKIFLDETEKLRARIAELEKRLSEYEDLHYDLLPQREAAESFFSLDGIFAFVLDTNGVVVKASPGAESLLTPICGDIMGRRVEDIVPPEHKSYVADAIKKAWDGVSVPILSIKSQRGDIIKYIDWCVPIVEDNRHQDEYLTCIGVDVTEKILLNRKLEENNRVFNELVANIPLIVAVTDINGTVINCSDSLCAKLEYSCDEVVGKLKINSIIGADCLSRLLCYKKADICLLNKSGARLPAEGVVIKPNSDDGYYVYIIDYVHCENASNEDQCTALDKIKDIEDARNSILTNLNHEIRTPLNGIIGFLDVLRQTPLDEMQEEYINIAYTSATGLLKVLHNFLDYAKIVNGAVEFNVTEFSTAEEFERLGKNFALWGSQKGVDTFVYIDPEIPAYIRGDSVQLSRVLSELLSNSVKFTDEGGSATFEVLLSDYTEDSCRLEFCVSDTGIGMSADELELLYKPFWQADNSVTRKYDGSGLGIVICSGLIELMGTKLKAESEPGKGSRFCFTLDFQRGSLTENNSLSYLNGLNVAVYKGYSSGRYKYISEYFRYLGCKTVFFHENDELHDDNLSFIYFDYHNLDESNIIKICESYPHIFKIVVLPPNMGDNDEIFSNIKNLHKLTAPVFFSNIQRAAGLYMSESTDKNTLKSSTGKYSGRVLVAEDSAVNRKLVCMMLEKLGLEIDSAENGQDAVDMALKNRYDIIFMDINMPYLDGIKATRLIHKYQKNDGIPRTPIVALTASIAKEEVDVYIANGMDGFLMKPLEKEMLQAVVSKFIPFKDKE